MSKVIKSEKVNYLDPNFPDTAYFACLFIPFTEITHFHPMQRLFPSIEEASHDIHATYKGLKKNKDILEFPDTCALVQVQRHQLIPLKPEYWNNPNTDFKYFDRVALFMDLFSKPDFHKLLVTPRFYDEKKDKWFYAASLPVRNTISDSAIEQFMLNSREPVEIKAKYAAFYTVIQHYKFNWKTKELEVSENSKISKPKN